MKYRGIPRLTPDITADVEREGTRILCVPNKKPGKKDFVVRLYYSSNKQKWFAATVENSKGVTVFIPREPGLHECIRVEKVFDNFAIGSIV